MAFDIIIVGAGASGLAAAYQAASTSPQLNILVLDKESVPGRKLSAAGNGKCNLTNQKFAPDCYHSKNRPFIADWTSRHSHKEILSFFESLGILLYQKDGYFYPVSNQGKQVTDMLYKKSMNQGVTFAFQTRVTAIQPHQSDREHFYRVDAVQEGGKRISYQTRFLILAAGGMAAPKLGGSQDGYLLAKQLKLDCTKIYPVLSPVYVEDPHLSYARGVRLDGMVTLIRKQGSPIKEYGQIQFNEKNLSGIVMMNLSNYLNSEDFSYQKDCLHLDVLPDFTWNRLMDFFISQQQTFPQESLELFLQGILPKAFVKYMLSRLHIDNGIPLGIITQKQLNRITSSLKKLTFVPVKTRDYEKAQVTGGGISLSEINPVSFSCKNYMNLYLTGELLDVNGKCGGYNLTFAILSGIEAATDITKRMEKKDA